MIIKLLAEGGSMKPGPAISQKLGPAGVNMGQVIQKVNDATKDFKGLKVPVELDIDPTTKEIQIKVFSPPVSELLKKELGFEKGSGKQKEFQSGNASIEQIIKIAKTKQDNLLSKDLKSAVKMVTGTCVSLGLLIESKPAKDVVEEISEGKYDSEINSASTETPPEKKKELDSYFSNLKKEQDKIKKQQEAAEAAKEAKK
jgi:large subunit ribosomal protein L11